MTFCYLNFMVVSDNVSCLRCFEKVVRVSRPSRFGTFVFVSRNSDADLLTGSAAVKVNALGSSASVTFTHRRSDTYPSVRLFEHSRVVTYIHVSVRQSVKNIHRCHSSLDCCVYLASSVVSVRPFPRQPETVVFVVLHFLKINPYFVSRLLRMFRLPANQDVL